MHATKRSRTRLPHTIGSTNDLSLRKQMRVSITNKRSLSYGRPLTSHDAFNGKNRIGFLFWLFGPFNTRTQQSVIDISQRISMDEKSQSRVTTDSLPGLGYEAEDASQSVKGGTVADTRDMSRMGKQQELRVSLASPRSTVAMWDWIFAITKRNFGFWSIVGFIMVLQSTWESMLLWADKTWTPKNRSQGWS